LRPIMAALRAEDRRTSSRIDTLVANSTIVRDRIRAYWRRDAEVIFPPVNVDAFQPVPANDVGDYFLMVSRLVPYKRFDLAIEACNTLQLPLLIVGTGRDRPRLEAMAGPTIRFLGRVTDQELARLYAHCRATIFMSDDDFGIAQVEAQAAGRPVIAYGSGGSLDTVLANVTGLFVPERTAESLIATLRHFESWTFNPLRAVAHAHSFSRERFQRQLTEVVTATLSTRRKGSAAWS
jgi:glycosyltransferase involved in cell wall biosynthesis